MSKLPVVLHKKQMNAAYQRVQESFDGTLNRELRSYIPNLGRHGLSNKLSHQSWKANLKTWANDIAIPDRFWNATLIASDGTMPLFDDIEELGAEFYEFTMAQTSQHRTYILEYLFSYCWVLGSRIFMTTESERDDDDARLFRLFHFTRIMYIPEFAKPYDPKLKIVSLASIWVVVMSRYIILWNNRIPRDLDVLENLLMCATFDKTAIHRDVFEARLINYILNLVIIKDFMKFRKVSTPLLYRYVKYLDGFAAMYHQLMQPMMDYITNELLAQRWTFNPNNEEPKNDKWHALEASFLELNSKLDHNTLFKTLKLGFSPINETYKKHFNRKLANMVKTPNNYIKNPVDFIVRFEKD
jgi:hypothetical protein